GMERDSLLETALAALRPLQIQIVSAYDAVVLNQGHSIPDVVEDVLVHMRTVHEHDRKVPPFEQRQDLLAEAAQQNYPLLNSGGAHVMPEQPLGLAARSDPCHLFVDLIDIRRRLETYFPLVYAYNL